MIAQEEKGEKTLSLLSLSIFWGFDSDFRIRATCLNRLNRVDISIKAPNVDLDTDPRDLHFQSSPSHKTLREASPEHLFTYLLTIFFYSTGKESD